MAEDLAVQFWRRWINGPFGTWVVFEHGTCVVLREPQGDLAHQARLLLAKWGPVYPGSPHGDFNVQTHPAWRERVVSCHHPDILCYVTPDEVEDGANNVAIGLLGRSKRNKDAHELKVVHVETAAGSTS
jgi:hypothetical protein